MNEFYDLIMSAYDLLTIVLPGFIFMSIKWWADNKNIESGWSRFLVWSVMISMIVSVFYQAIHLIILPNWDCPEPFKIVVYIVTCSIAAYLVLILKNNRTIRIFLSATIFKTPHNDIFWDVIDYSNGTLMRVYLKNESFYYVGQFSMREEKGDESWISLFNYGTVDYATGQMIYDAKANKDPTIAMVRLKDVSRIELVYDDNSDVWKNICNNDEEDE